MCCSVCVCIYTYMACIIILYISNKIGMHIIRMLHSVYIPNSVEKDKLILMKGMSWKLLFPLGEILPWR